MSHSNGLNEALQSSILVMSSLFCLLKQLLSENGLNFRIVIRVGHFWTVLKAIE